MEKIDKIKELMDMVLTPEEKETLMEHIIEKKERVKNDNRDFLGYQFETELRNYYGSSDTVKMTEAMGIKYITMILYAIYLELKEK